MTAKTLPYVLLHTSSSELQNKKQHGTMQSFVFTLFLSFTLVTYSTIHTSAKTLVCIIFHCTGFLFCHINEVV